MTDLTKKIYEIYNIETYAESHGSFIKDNRILVDNIETLCKMLEKKSEGILPPANISIHLFIIH